MEAKIEEEDEPKTNHKRLTKKKKEINSIENKPEDEKLCAICITDVHSKFSYKGRCKYLK